MALMPLFPTQLVLAADVAADDLLVDYGHLFVLDGRGVLLPATLVQVAQH
jgi:hypothetical protein